MLLQKVMETFSMMSIVRSYNFIQHSLACNNFEYSPSRDE